MRKLLNERRVLIILAVLVMLGFIFTTLTAIRAFTLEPGQEVTTSGGITIAKPSNNITDATLRPDGVLVVKYEDGSVKEVGYILGQNGKDGESISPTQAQIAVAVADYCTTNNRCDAKSPTVDQVALAVATYCSTRNECIGATGATGTSGTNGTNATPEQIFAAVTEYCADGRCRGPQGEQGIQGLAGIDGQDPVLGCVVRNNQEYVAWKYATEANSAYRDLYQLPPLAQGQNCIEPS